MTNATSSQTTGEEYHQQQQQQQQQRDHENNDSSTTTTKKRQHSTMTVAEEEKKSNNNSNSNNACQVFVRRDSKVSLLLVNDNDNANENNHDPDKTTAETGAATTTTAAAETDDDEDAPFTRMTSSEHRRDSGMSTLSIATAGSMTSSNLGGGGGSGGGGGGGGSVATVQSLEGRGMKTEWEDGLDCIDSLLRPDSRTLHAMSPAQQQGLRKVKEMLLTTVGTMGSSSSCSTLIQNVPKALLETDSRSSVFILQEYAGYTAQPTALPQKTKPTPRDTGAHKLSAIIGAHSIARRISKRFKNVDENDIDGYDISNIPQHWHTLNPEEQLHLRDLLSWDNLSCWKNFNIFDVHETLRKKHTLVFVAWAILASPLSQHSLDIACKKVHRDSKNIIMDIELRDGYDFTNKLGIQETTLLKFLYALEERYNSNNPYHNEVHAADVTQSLHALLFMGGEQFATEKWEVFAVLMAAVGHDVDHCGMNNQFHINSRSNLAITYNDDAILENHHASVFFSLIQGETRQAELDFLEILGPATAEKIRKFIIQVILSTDMTKHFKKNDCIKSFLALSSTSTSNTNASFKQRVAGTTLGSHTEPIMQHQATRHEVLSFLCHMADISNPTKSQKVMTRWTARVMEEFYRQGDTERRLELPISPCCDRTSQKLEDVQIGFINFIVLPSFKLLGELIPEATEDIVPQITHNLHYWKKKLKQQAAATTSPKKVTTATEIQDTTKVAADTTTKTTDTTTATTKTKTNGQTETTPAI